MGGSHMFIGNSFEYANTQELKRRLVEATNVGRQKLSLREFEPWVSQFQGTLRAIDNALEQFENRIIFRDSANTNTVNFRKFCFRAASLTRLQPNVYLGSPASAVQLIGAPGLASPQQSEFQFCSGLQFGASHIPTKAL